MDLEAALVGAGLAKPRRSGDGFLACCPLHDDHEPSLHLWEDDAGELAFSCLAGCSWSDVKEKLVELGLPVTSRGGDKDPGPIIAATYDYRDEQDTLVYQVLRYQPKDFRQQRPNGGGGWTWNLKDTPRLLFRLPELIAGVAAANTSKS